MITVRKDILDDIMNATEYRESKSKRGKAIHMLKNQYQP